MQAADGNFYGTTTSGWGGRGKVFKLTVDGELTTLAWFGGGLGFGAGADPLGDLVQGPDWKLYGVTRAGGCNNSGTIFRISTNGNIENLHLFCGDDGIVPSGGLLLASDGNFYGVTAGGGADWAGTLYRITTNAVLTTLGSFHVGRGNAAYPFGKLLQANDASFYGGAAGGWNTIFRYAADGTLRTFARFEGDPVSGMVQASDGYIYGCTYDGGWNFAGGTVFSLDPIHGCTNQAWTSCDNFTNLFLFGETASGWHPYAGLIQGKDGNLYGTTAFGGAHGAGNIFRIIMGADECSLTCPTNISVCNDPGQSGALVHFASPATANCNGFVITSTPTPGSFFPVGTNTVLCIAVGPASGRLTNTCTFLVTVRDCEPPVIHRIAASPDALWPPNQRMQPITLAISATDNCPLARSKIISVSSNGTPPDNSSRTASTDWEITGDLTVNLRAARSGSGGNRVYSIAVECRDESGNSATSVVRVAVER